MASCKLMRRPQRSLRSTALKHAPRTGVPRAGQAAAARACLSLNHPRSRGGGTALKHTPRRGWPSGGCTIMFLNESSALAWGRDCPETHAAHGGSEGWSSGGREGMFVTDIIRARAGAGLP